MKITHKIGFTLAEVGFSVGCSDSETRNIRSSVEGGKISGGNLEPVQEQNSRIIRYKWAFTLAEVLITLGIIGIVAALTIPSLMANIQGKSNQNKFKKALATLEQAGRMSLAKNDFSYGDVNKECGGDEADYCSDNLMNDFNSDNQTICKIMETSLKGVNYLAPYPGNNENTNIYESISNIAETKIIGGNRHYWGKNTIGKSGCLASYGYYLLPDGAVVGVSIGNTGIRLSLPCSVKAGEKFDSHWINNHDTGTTTSYCLGFIDVNGPNGPNKEVECSDGVETTNEVENPCVVKTKDITDMFPIAFHDATVEPASNAAMYVFRHAK